VAGLSIEFDAIIQFVSCKLRNKCCQVLFSLAHLLLPVVKLIRLSFLQVKNCKRNRSMHCMSAGHVISAITYTDKQMKIGITCVEHS